MSGSEPPLFVTAQDGDEPVVSALLRSGADPNLPGADGSTPLIAAVRKGRHSVVSTLLRAGAAVNLPQRGGWSPLVIAVDCGQEAIVDTLLQSGADPNFAAQGWTPLMSAAAYGRVSVALALLRSGANINSTTAYGVTALWVAANGGHQPLLSTLLQAGADPNAVHRDGGETALVTAARRGCHGCVALLIAAGAIRERVGLPLLELFSTWRTPTRAMLRDAEVKARKATSQSLELALGAHMPEFELEVAEYAFSRQIWDPNLRHRARRRKRKRGVRAGAGGGGGE